MKVKSRLRSYYVVGDVVIEFDEADFYYKGHRLLVVDRNGKYFVRTTMVPGYRPEVDTCLGPFDTVETAHMTAQLICD